MYALFFYELLETRLANGRLVHGTLFLSHPNPWGSHETGYTKYNIPCAYLMPTLYNIPCAYLMPTLYNIPCAYLMPTLYNIPCAYLMPTLYNIPCAYLMPTLYIHPKTSN